jgi:hypothetical protein
MHYCLCNVRPGPSSRRLKPEASAAGARRINDYCRHVVAIDYSKQDSGASAVFCAGMHELLMVLHGLL